MSRSKINELLSRARQISNEAERIEKSQSPIIGVRPSTRLSSSFQKKSPSPVSQTSFLSNEDRSPIIEHPSNRTYRNIGIKKHSLKSIRLLKKLQKINLNFANKLKNM